ncbi:hypothetical protein GCM10011538_20690 [Ligilactobacillus murinus]
MISVATSVDALIVCTVGDAIGTSNSVSKLETNNFLEFIVVLLSGTYKHIVVPAFIIAREIYCELAIFC